MSQLPIALINKAFSAGMTSFTTEERRYSFIDDYRISKLRRPFKFKKDGIDAVGA